MKQASGSDKLGMLYVAEVVSAAPISDFGRRPVMWYVGLDAHTRVSSFCVLDEHGRKLFGRTVHGSYSKVVKAMESVKQPFSVCFEASTGYGWLYEKLSELAQRVVVAHPAHLRLTFRSKRKNDRIDAGRLAKLLYLDEVPPVHVPDGRVRAWRVLINLRSKLVARRTAVKNRIRALLRSQAIKAPRSLWSKAGLKWLSELSWPSHFEALSRDLFLEELHSAQQAIARVEKVLKAEADRRPAVQLLMTVPGVGIRTAEAVVAHMDGADRFGRNSAVGAYFGLVPCLDSSAGKDRLGHITRQGPAVARCLLSEAAWQSVRRSPSMRAFFEQVMDGQAKGLYPLSEALQKHLLPEDDNKVGHLREDRGFIANLGRAYLETGDLSKAQNRYMLFLRLAPNELEGYNGLGETAFRQDDYEKAPRLFGHSLQFYGDQPQTAGRICEIAKKSDDLAGKAQWVLANYAQRGQKPAIGSLPNMPGSTVPEPPRATPGVQFPRVPTPGPRVPVPQPQLPVGSE